MRIYLATDHAGFALKEEVKRELIAKKDHFQVGEIIDCGAEHLQEGDNYPPYMALAAKHIQKDALHDPSLGIIFGGSGQGEAIVANRFKHVRAIVYAGGDLELVKLGKEHNDANVLSIGARFVSLEEAMRAIHVFLSTPFSHEERHADRIIMIEEVTKE